MTHDFRPFNSYYINLDGSYPYSLFTIPNDCESYSLGNLAQDFSDGPIRLILKKADKHIDLIDVEYVRLLQRVRLLHIWQKIDNSNDVVHHLLIDASNAEVLFEQDASREAFRYNQIVPASSDMLRARFGRTYTDERDRPFYRNLDENDLSTHWANGKNCYFFSVFGEVANLYVNEFLTKLGKLSRLENLFPDADDVNYVLEVEDWRDSEYIGHLLHRHIINMPSLYGAPLDYIYDYAGEAGLTDNPIVEAYTADEEAGYGVRNALVELQSHFKNGDDTWCALLTHYPKQLFVLHKYDVYKNGKFENGYGYSDEAKQFDNQIKENWLYLKECGKLAPRWISEFSLYLEVKKLYKQTIYQYRCDWLGKQSLDIYIPNKKLGIEYQGEQHYRPVSIFGDEEAFAYRQELDARKRELCVANGVKLLEWPFDLEITPSEVKKQIKAALKS